MRLFRRYLILTHRYLGIALGLLIIIWFASGIVMMYAGGMPRLAPELRLERMPDLDLSRVTLTPAQAADAVYAATSDPGRRSGRGGGGRVQLLTVLDRPAYRIGGATLFADNGQILTPADTGGARTIAAGFVGVPVERVEFVRTLDRVDQWTLGQTRTLPLHKFRLDDAAGTEVYVQPATAEVALLTTRRQRTLAWLGAIPHWLYFAALRENQPLWYQTVVWTSGAACALSVMGMILGMTQFRRPKPFQLSKAIPYSGWMRWHYITGVVFGLFTLTWAFSGLLSMEPFEWTNATGLEVEGDVMSGGPVDLASFPAFDAAAWTRTLGGRGIKEMEFSRIQDRHYYVVRLAADRDDGRPRERLHQPYQVTARTEQDRVLVDADGLQRRHEPFTAASLLARLSNAFPGTRVVESAVLSEYDSYYYSRGRQTPLPVLRVKFADPAQTWVYVDPETSQVLAEIGRLNRVERWLYNGLHSLDFSFWYDRRPLWDIGMIVLLTGGMITSVLGLFLGMKRLVRATAR